MKMRIYFGLLFFCISLISNPIMAATQDEFFRQSGKSNTVTGVIIIIFICIILFLVRLENKIFKIEKQFKNEQ